MEQLVLQAGAFGLCVMLIALLSKVVLKQSDTINNHLDSIERSLLSLPCRTDVKCPEDLK